MNHVVGLKPSLEAHDRLLLPPSLDLGLVAVELGIEHRMRAQPIGAAFQKIGLAGFAHRMDRTARCGLDGDHVHAVDGFGGNPVARRLALDVGFRFRNRQRRSHGVEIVFAHEQHRQSPQRGQIQALVKLAFGDGAFAEEAGGDDVLAPHAIGERKSDRQRQTAADDGIAAIEIGGAVEQVHGAAAPAAAAFLLSVHLREHRRHRHAAHQRVPVLAIGGDDPVALFQHRDDADGDRFLAVVEMQKPADLLLRVEFGAFVLEPADADHLLQQIQHVLARQMRLVGWLRSSLLAFERRNVALRQAELAGLEQAAHDLAAARLRQVLPKRDVLRRDRRAEALARMAEQLLAQRLARLDAVLERDDTP